MLLKLLNKMHMYNLSIIFLPLMGSLISGFFCKFIGNGSSISFGLNSIFFTFFISLISSYTNFIEEFIYYIYVMSWVNSNLFSCNWSFMFDTLTCVMLLVITFISSLVHLYSTSYMSNDPHISRFMSLLNIFTFLMLILVTADNFIIMFFGWEGVGFCSYLLINFWNNRLQANKAAIKAMVVNRISDFALLLGFLTIFFSLKSLEYSSIFSSINLIENHNLILFQYNFFIIDLISIFILIGLMGKSAQLFLHIWLPDAMEGPTPVSALIHAATMVTAGIFLITRCSPIFELAPKILKIVTIVGAATAFFGGTVGLAQNDLKKVIAYSTCSQLGYMFFACGLSNYSLGIFHLFNHSFFKALLFLSAGSVIHSMNNEQDMRKMGGLRRILPFTYIMFIIGSLSLIGFPFLTGFYSKDPILEIAYASHNNIGHFAFWLGIFASFCTSFYSARLIYLTFLSETNAYKNVIKNVHEAPTAMSIPLFFLALGSIFMGYISKDMFIGLGTDFWGNSIFINSNNIQIIDAEFLPFSIKFLPFFISMLALCLIIFLYKFNLNLFFELKISDTGVFFYNFLNKKWFFDKVYQENITQFFINISYFKMYKLIDKGFIDVFGPKGFSYYIANTADNLKKIQTGYIYNYTLLMLIFLIILGFLFCLSIILINTDSDFSGGIFYINN